MIGSHKTGIDLEFLANGGEMGRLMRHHDWASSPLGSPERWPQSLASVVGLLLNSKFPMFVAWGAELGFLYNDAYIDVLGAKHPTALGARFYDIWAEIWPDISPLIDAAMAGEATYRSDLPLLMHRKGFDEQTWFTFSYSPVRDEIGEIVGMFCACTETTDRILAEHKIQESETRARSVLDGMGEAFLLLDRDFRIIEVNQEALRLEGRPREEIVGSVIGEVWPGIEKTEQGKLCSRVMASGVAEAVEASYSWPDGRSGWFDLSAFPAAEGVAMFYREITDRKSAEASLAESEERLRLAVSNAEVGFWDVDVVNDTLIWPAATKAMFGIAPETPVTMQDFYDGLHPDDRKATSEAYAAAADPARRALYDVEYRTVGRQHGIIRWVAAKGRGVFDEAGRCLRVTGTAIEITARKQAEEALRELNATLETRVAEAIAEREQAEEALRQSQKMEAMGQLTGGVAHDFNNLLTPIVGSLDMLQRKGVGGEREQRLIAGAMQSAERARTLVQRLLAFARRQPLQLVPVDVAKIVNGMAELVSSTTGPQIKVVVDAPDNLPLSSGDINQLEMALLNLSVNARDAMPDGGTLRISANAEALGAGHPSKLKPGDYIRLSVADTGIGMDEATLARAIEPFFSTKGIGKGTGLGLSMVHGLASQLGGALTLRSKPGLGTNVEFWLPLTPDAPPVVSAASPTGDAAARSGVVLLVDDEEIVRMSTADMLNELGYTVVEAASGEEAVQILDRGDDFDLLLTDHLMPGMNGTDLAAAFRNARPGVPVLLVSGYAERDGISPDLPRLIKPFRRDELVASLAPLTKANTVATTR